MSDSMAGSTSDSGDLPWLEAEPLSPASFEKVRMQTIFDCFKWDAQVEDVGVLADYPLILTAEAWKTIAGLAEKLAAETMAAEQEIVCHPELVGQLGLPRSIVGVWRNATRSASSGNLVAAQSRQDVRLMRFDFHYTTEGWRISEVNSDVPGGFNEASGFTQLMAQYYRDTAITADPTVLLADAVRQATSTDAQVALVHATAYTDDRQVMMYIGQELERQGLHPILVSPTHLRWQNGQAELATTWQTGRVDFIMRFFPAEWLPNLARTGNWRAFFTGNQTPACNPALALITQSKRFPLVWDHLSTPLPTWKALLPETIRPGGSEHIPGAAKDWIYKPALGRVGEDIGMVGVSSQKQWRQIRRSARWFPGHWIRQRRFMAIPMKVAGENWYPCLGVYTINGRAAGIYGRIGSKPLIASTAKDIAVLVAQ